MNWIKAKYNFGGHYLMNDELKDVNKVIIVSYQTTKGRNYVTTTQCNHGLVSKQINGEITAFMFIPEPYRE